MIKRISNKDVASFWATLSSEEIASLRGAKFAFSVAKNRLRIKPIIEALEAVRDQGVEILREFNERRVSLCSELADKDEEGLNKITNRQFSITENREEFDARFDKLLSQYQSEIDEKKRFDAEFMELLEKEEEIDLHMVGISDVPDDISVSTMSGLEPMILDE